MKTLGILGGVGPQTTTKIYHSIINSFRKKGVNRYPSIVIYNMPFPFVIENEAILEGKNVHKMIPYLIKGAKVLEKSGASFGILPCNTLHKFIDRVRKSVNIPFLSILEETVIFLKSLNIKTVGLLATQTSVKDGLYKNILGRNKIGVIYPPKSIQKNLDKTIIKILSNKTTNIDKKKLKKICNNMQKNKKIGALLLACTDLQSIAYDVKLKIPLIDTTDILIKASLRELKKTSSISICKTF